MLEAQDWVPNGLEREHFHPYAGLSSESVESACRHDFPHASCRPEDKSGFSEKPVTFRVGRGDAIPGLDRGVVGMSKGTCVA